MTSSVDTNVEYVEWWLLQHASRGNNITVTKQIFGKCTQVLIFAKQTSRGITIVIIIIITTYLKEIKIIIIII